MRELEEQQQLRRIAFENPWWSEGVGISTDYRGMRPRAYLSIVHPLVTSMDPRRALVLMGPRRVGKTVLLHHSIQRLIDDGVPSSRIVYISADHPLFVQSHLEDLMRLALEAQGQDAVDPSGYTFFFDEVQYVDQWENQLKVLVDSYRSTKFVVSGSAAAALKLKSNESGAGRFTDFVLPPLTFYEFIELTQRRDVMAQSDGGWLTPARDIDELNSLFIDYLNYGGFPEVALSETIRAHPEQFVRRDLVDKVLLRDLPTLYGIQDVQELYRLFTVLCWNTGQEVSLDKLSKRSGVSKPTLNRYLKYLESAFLIGRLRRVDQDGKRFTRERAFKVYLTNPSLRAALFAPEPDDGEDIGSLVETDIYAQWRHADFLNPQLNYAHWDKKEIDFIQQHPLQTAGFYALEVKWSDRPLSDTGMLKALAEFGNKHADRSPILVCTTKTRSSPSIQMGAVQVSFYRTAEFAYALGRQSISIRRED